MMLNFLLKSVAVIAAILPLSRAITAQPHYATVVMEYPSKKILYNENAETQNQPASLTKVMTLYLVFQALDKDTLTLTQPLHVSVHAANRQPSKLGLRANDIITVQEAISGLVTKSANDAAAVLAEALAPSEDAFAKKMTAQARRLGLKKTTFKNASGIADAGQLTTALDMALLAAAMLRDYPQYYHFFSLREFNFRNQRFTTHNHLLGKYSGCDGIKTGFTNASGFNLLSSARRDGHRLIAVVLGGTSIKSRDHRMMQILDIGFSMLGETSKTANPIVLEPLSTINLQPTMELPKNTTLEEAY